MGDPPVAGIHRLTFGGDPRIMGVIMVTITKEHLENWKTSGFILSELFPMGVMGVFDAPISSEIKVRILLREEILGSRGLIYVTARAVR